MNRKEAHDYMWKCNEVNPAIKWQHHATTRQLITLLIDRIFDEQESQICPNCAHDHCGCSVQDSILQIDPDADFSKFGCNGFELPNHNQ